MNRYFEIGLGVAVIVAIGYIGWKYYKTTKQEISPKQSFKKCQLEDIVKWFNNDENSKKLKNNPSCIAVLIKQPNTLAVGLENNDILLAIFDQEKSEIYNGIIFNCLEISNEVTEIFSNKDMVVLK
jgi:hypothetical protein